MKKVELMEYFDKFIEAAILQGQAQTRNARVANRQYTILKRIFMKAEKNIDEATVFYRKLRCHPEPNVKLWASADSLALGLDVAQSENILFDLSQKEDIGPIRLNAEMTLKVWKKQGYLRF